jgi:hypothetical protein
VFFVARRTIRVPSRAALTFGDGDIIILTTGRFHVEKIRALTRLHAVRIYFVLVFGVAVVHVGGVEKGKKMRFERVV